MPGTGKDFHHACMNGNLDLFQASVRTHASEMERSGIEPLRLNYAHRFVRSPQKTRRIKHTVAAGHGISAAQPGRRIFMNKEELMKKTKDLIAVPYCCSELKTAAQNWLDAVGTEKERKRLKNTLPKWKQTSLPLTT